MTALDDLPGMLDLLVIGAGPAGMAAALEAHEHGLKLAIIDENPHPGGQVYRQVAASPFRNDDILGSDYWHGETLVREVSRRGIAILPRTTIWTVENAAMPFTVGLSSAGRACLVETNTLILASGAQERPFPIDGWTLPGVMSAGAAQTVLKSSGIVPEGRIVLAGCGPLLYLLAWQYLNAGIGISALLDTTPAANWRAAFPHLAAFAASPYLLKGGRLLAKVLRSVRVVHHVSALRAVGGGRLEAVSFARGSREESLLADTLLLHQGVVPDVNLAVACGLRTVWDQEQLCFRPDYDHSGESSVPGIFVAGDGARIAGAAAAPWSGRLAALAVAMRLGKITSVNGMARWRDFDARLARNLWGRAFLDALYRPASQFRIPPAADTLVCRCEEVSAGQIRQAASQGAMGPNQVKSYLRCGMGPCQGRLCGLTVAEVMAEARGLSPAEIGYYRLRPPVKPVTLGELAAMPQTENSIKAVVRI